MFSEPFRPAARFPRRSRTRRDTPAPAPAEVLEPRTLLSATGLSATGDGGDEDGHGHDHDGHCHCGHCGGGADLHALPLPDRTLGPGGGTGDYAGTGAVRPLADTFRLQSNPGADHTIFLDFDGHVTKGTYWNGGDRLVTHAFSRDGDAGFSDAELGVVQGVWQRVAEDFLPFEVNVTTRDPGAAALSKGGAGDDAWGVRIAVGGSWRDWFGHSAGGVAYVGSFNFRDDTPAFVFSENLGNSEKNVAEAVTHEAGHALGLRHDGTQSQGYYTGHGTGATGWAPIMGVGYYRELTQWSRGEYAGANEKEDDLAVITSRNGFGYRADDYGDDFAAAADLAFAGGANRTLSGSGIIERNADVDAFRFSTTGGAVALRADVAGRGANLDVRLELRNAAGETVAVADPAGRLWAEIAATLSAGDYALHVTGTGDGDPRGGGYGDYGSLGAYRLSGTVPGGAAVRGGGADGGAGDTDFRTGDDDSRVDSGGDPPRGRDARVIVKGPRILRISERGTRRRFRVRLADRPESRVVIRVRSADRTEGRVRVRKLVFTPGNWNRQRRVAVIGRDDRGRDGHQYFRVKITAARSRDAAYAGLDADDVWALNRDDDGRRRRGRRSAAAAPPRSPFGAAAPTAAPAAIPPALTSAPVARRHAPTGPRPATAPPTPSPGGRLSQGDGLARGDGGETGGSGGGVAWGGAARANRGVAFFPAPGDGDPDTEGLSWLLGVDPGR